jgi:transcriptional regulator of acetoin/glycerol metabolism
VRAQLEHEEAAAHEVARFVEHHLPSYAWPGGRRELWQCARGVLIHGRYNAPQAPRTGSAIERLAQRLERAELSAEALLDAYVTVAYHRTGSYQEAARQLGLDRRTVKTRIDADLLEELRREARA